jgi:plastocyanin
MFRSVRPALLGSLALAASSAIAACGGAPASAGPATAVPSGVVAVEARNNPYAFSPSTLLVPAGTVTFSVKNVGTEEHEFEIFKGDTVVDEVEGLVPGVTLPLTVNLEAGDYTYVCKIAGHEEAGMKGTLTVTG